ncbi:unnamed protein product [Candidula unifasciata]|uniref:SOCS box domain-containing protein n=1 Tax=Candidula unifasciata TaxID=100452 RepID=A0A8S3Z4B5_9EUPU|nr:unnamed protein product [Candidula unifasciata]
MDILLQLCQTPAHNSAQLQQELSEKVLEVARKHHLDLSQPEKLSVGIHNPLSEACLKGNLAIVKLFLDHGASLNFLDSEGRSPLFLAISGYFNTHESIAQLLKWGANVNLHKHGRCPLLTSFYSMKHETTKLLIKHGANINNVILPTFCFVEAVFALNSNLVMMASGVRFHLENFSDLVSLAVDIITAGLSPRMFYLSGRRFLLGGFTAKELSQLWSFQHLCLILGFKIERTSLQDAINELHNSLATEQNSKRKAVLKDRLDKLCWTQVFLSEPLPLTYLARIAIRGHLVQPHVNKGRHINENIDMLPLPAMCKGFLNLQRCTIQGIADYMY